MWHRADGSSCVEELAQRHRLSPPWDVSLSRLSDCSCFLIHPCDFCPLCNRTHECHSSKTSDIYLSTGRRLSCVTLKHHKVVDWRRRDYLSVCFTALWQISNQTTLPPKPPEFFNICIYSCLSRVWCPHVSVLVQSWLMRRFTFRLVLHISKCHCCTCEVRQVCKCFIHQTPYFRLFNLMYI